jgi:hypothetical protein
MKKKESNCRSKKLKSGHLSQKGPDTKMNWPTDRRAQYNFYFYYGVENLILQALTFLDHLSLFLHWIVKYVYLGVIFDKKIT